MENDFPYQDFHQCNFWQPMLLIDVTQPPGIPEAGHRRCVMRDAKFGAQREGVELVREAQAVELEGGVNGHEDVV
jgi:hypothetical protein